MNFFYTGSSFNFSHLQVQSSNGFHSADHADHADHADNPDYADHADHADHGTDYADSADYATDSTDYATEHGSNQDARPKDISSRPD